MTLHYHGFPATRRLVLKGAGSVALVGLGLGTLSMFRRKNG